MNLHAFAPSVPCAGTGKAFHSLFETIDLTYQMKLIKHRIRQTSLLRGLVRRVAYFLLAISATFMQHGRTVAARNNLETSFKSLVSQIATPDGVTLASVESADAYLGWLGDALVPELSAARGSRSDSTLIGWWRANMLVGTARLAQVRVKSDSCSWKQWAGAHFVPITGVIDGRCLGTAEPSTMMSESFGPFYDPERYESTHVLGEWRYIVDLADDPKYGELRLQELRKTGFVDEKTRKLTTSFTFYNDALPMLCFVTIELHVSVTGMLRSSISAQSVDPHEYLSWSPSLQICLEVLVVVATLCFGANEMLEMFQGFQSARSTRYRLVSIVKYLIDPKNLLDVSIITLTLTAAALWMGLLRDNERQVDLSTQAYVDLEVIAMHLRNYRLVSCLVLLLHLLGLLPFLEMSDKLSLVTRSIFKAMSDLPAFMVIFFLVLLSYATIGHLLFGPHITEWDSLPDSLVVCWDMMRWTGWRFERLSVHFEGDSSATMVAAAYYYTYVLLMQFMHANILTAILMAGYQGVRAEMRKPEYRHFKQEAGSVPWNEWITARIMLLRLRQRFDAMLGKPNVVPLVPWTQERWLRDMHLVHTHYLCEHTRIMKTVRRRSLPASGSLFSRVSSSLLDESISDRHLNTLPSGGLGTALAHPPLPHGVKYDPETKAMHMRRSRLLLEIQELPTSKVDDVLAQGQFHFKVRNPIMADLGVFGTLS